MQESIALTVNGHEHTVMTDPHRPLLDVLREDLGLTGASSVAASISAAPARCSSTASRRTLA